MSTPPSPDPFSTSSTPSFNGYHLLNEVSTGGTLSSLFSILSLFTEDVKLSWSPDKTQDGTPDDQDEEEEEEVRTGRPEGKSRTNSDVSQLGEGIIGKDERLQAEGMPTPMPVRPRSSSDGPIRHRDSVSSADDATIRESVSDTEGDEGNTTINAVDYAQPTAGISQRPSPARTNSIRPDSTRPLARDKPRRAKMGPTALNGTIARATVDTTLAVIPAEAFRKLTRKFPKASGTIVQVVLERFSRVTFMTGKFISRATGLTV
jgi:lysophospholipid hydrolase